MGGWSVNRHGRAEALQTSAIIAMLDLEHRATHVRLAHSGRFIPKAEFRAVLTNRLARQLGLGLICVPRLRFGSIKLKQRPQEPLAGGREGLPSVSAAPIYDHPLLSSPLDIGASR